MTTSNETHLTVAITDLIISEGIHFNLAQKPRFKRVLDLARTVSNSYQPPNRKLISNDILDVIHDQNTERNLSLIKTGSNIFGFLFLCEGTTISIILLLNILDSGKNLIVIVLELVDGKKYGTFICTRFIYPIRIDPHKSITDVVMFDGASNVQISDELLKIDYPKVSVRRGVEHNVSLFLNDVSKIPFATQTITDHKAIYNLFASGIYHKPYSIFND